MTSLFNSIERRNLHLRELIVEIGRDTDVDLCIPKPLVGGLTIGLTSGLDKVLDEGLLIGLGIVVVPNYSSSAGHVLGHCRKV